MNNLAPLLCLGFDSGAPLLKKISSTSFFWNLLFLNAIIFISTLLLAIHFQANSKIQTILFGISASTTLAVTIVIANYRRSHGETRQYFLSVNVYDRLLRTFIIIGCALLINNLTNWAAAICLLSAAYAIYIAKLTKTKIDLNYQKFINQLKISIPFIFVSLGILVISRIPFYASYFFDNNIYAAKLDFFLLFSLFILIPFLNQSKIQEAKSEASLSNYLEYMRQGWRHIFIQELFIMMLMFVLAWIAIFIKKADGYEIKYICAPILCGMILVSSIPNFIQLICFSMNGNKAIRHSITLVLITLLIYTPKIFFREISTTFFFVASTVLYVIFGCLVAKNLRIKLNMFLRLTRTIILLLLLWCFYFLI